jgi:manganese oxidase
MADVPMQMPLPENTLPMMTGTGPHGSIDMGGMFTVVKIRADLAHNDYRDPGWYEAPKGSVAYLWSGEEPAASRDG